MPKRWQVDVKLNSTAAVRPPLSEPTNSQFLRPIAIRFISRSATLLSIAKSPRINNLNKFALPQL